MLNVKFKIIYHQNLIIIFFCLLDKSMKMNN